METLTLTQEAELEFEITDDNGLKFLVQFVASENGRNLLMNVIHNNLHLDTSEIRTDDPQLFKNIIDGMMTTNINHFNNVSV